MRTEESIGVTSSNFRGDKFATKKISDSARRISFRDLAKLAVPRKTEMALAEATGSEPRTAKRWLSRRYRGRLPAVALQFVLGEIIRKLE